MALRAVIRGHRKRCKVLHYVLMTRSAVKCTLFTSHLFWPWLHRSTPDVVVPQPCAARQALGNPTCFYQVLTIIFGNGWLKKRPIGRCLHGNLKEDTNSIWCVIVINNNTTYGLGNKDVVVKISAPCTFNPVLYPTDTWTHLQLFQTYTPMHSLNRDLLCICMVGSTHRTLKLTIILQVSLVRFCIRL